MVSVEEGVPNDTSTAHKGKDGKPLLICWTPIRNFYCCVAVVGCVTKLVLLILVVSPSKIGRPLGAYINIFCVAISLSFGLNLRLIWHGLRIKMDLVYGSVVMLFYLASSIPILYIMYSKWSTERKHGEYNSHDNGIAVGLMTTYVIGLICDFLVYYAFVVSYRNFGENHAPAEKVKTNKMKQQDLIASPQQKLQPQ